MRSFLKASGSLSPIAPITTPTADQKMLRSIHMASARASPSWPTGSSGGFGRALLDLEHDELGVAVDVGADLQHRRLAIAAGQRHQVGLGHDVGDLTDFQASCLMPKATRTFSENGEVAIVMQDQVGHDAPVINGSSPARPGGRSPVRPRPRAARPRNRATCAAPPVACSLQRRIVEVSAPSASRSRRPPKKLAHPR